jgi:hypothetical protein
MRTIEAVEIFKEGVHRDEEYDSLSLSSLSAGFKFVRSDVPVLVNHDGGAVVGKVTAVWGEDDRLLADIEVDDGTFQRIVDGELHAVSIKPVFDGGLILSEVSLLDQSMVPFCEGLQPLSTALDPVPGS